MKKKTESPYIDIPALVEVKDLDKEEPSIILITSNRSGGKTTGALKLQLEDFRDTGRKAMLLYRDKGEAKSSSTVYSDVLRSYPALGKDMKSEPRADGLFYEMFLDGKSFGFACGIKQPDKLKKYSPFFTDVYYITMDEFQTESGQYLLHEVQKIQSILLTIARGGGKQVRPVKLLLLGNMVTLMNPYFIYFGIHKRLKEDTKCIRGNGWVAHFVYNKSAAEQIKQSGIYRAFQNDEYMNYSTENVYLVDSAIFLDAPKGKAYYVCTIVHENIKYGIRDYVNDGIVYVSRKYDPSCKNVVTFKASNHTQNTTMLTHYSYLWKVIKDAYLQGSLRFDDLQTKNAMFDILAIDLYK